MSDAAPGSALVTGASGFVGGHLVARLAAGGWSVTALARHAPTTALPASAVAALADIRDGEALARVFAEARPEVVFHLAAQASLPLSMREPAADVETNVLGSVRVALAAAAAGARRIVFFSSGGTLYGQPERLPADEATALAPRSVYGASKIAAEHELGALCPYLGLELAVLRPGNIYGPRQRAGGESSVVAIFIERMLRDEPVTIFGDGSQRRDYVYVADVVEAAVLAAQREPASCVVGSGRGTSTLELFEALAELTGYDRAPRLANERPGEIAAIWLDASGARERWGWEPRVPLAEGLAATVEWFRGGGEGTRA